MHNKRIQRLRAALRIGLVPVCAAASPMPAAAQEGGTGDQADDNAAIIVTGSRIARRDYQANSPIVTVGAELLENSSSSAIETNLNKLPQFTPAQTPALGGDIQPTATNTPGAATVSLRGIGPNRNLVLVDGRRATPGNANMVVDINTIPSAAVERVEVITGGASATYGADAVGGVVNFILKKNFQGLQLDGQIGITERGDGQEYRVSGIMGTDFADGRGNISIAFETNDRHNALRRDRPWFIDFWNDPDTAGVQLWADQPSYVPGVNRPSQDVMNGIFDGRDAAAFPNYPTNGTVWFNGDGTAFGGLDFATRAGSYRFNGSYGPQMKQTSLGTLAANWLDEQLVLPLNRWNMYARGSYEIEDWVSLVAQGYFNKASTHTQQQRASAVNGWSVNIPASHPVPDELRAMLNSRTPIATASASALAALNCPDASADVPGSAAGCDWQLNQYALDVPRTVDTDVYTYQMMVGLEGKIPGTDWTWDVTGSHGESETSAYLGGYVSLERYRTVMRAPNWGAGFVAQGNEVQGGFGASSATCTSGLNPFDDIATSADCIEAITANIKTRSVMKQTIWEGNAQGSLLALPAGDLRAAIGASYRENRFTFTNDTLSTQGQSFLDQVVGLYPSGNSEGTISVREFYGELLVPVLADLPLIRKLELELGARTSHFNTTGNSFTWKALADWQVTDWLRLRGGFNKAERAPNIAELFQAPQQTFSSLPLGDVCSDANSLPYSAGPGNTTNRTAVRALCETLMNRIDPSTAANFYGNAGNQVPGATTGFVTSIGNTSVQPESAKTWTAGMVLSAPSQATWLRGLRLSVDYYHLKVDDAIGAETGDIIQQKCFDTAFNPTLDADSPFCRNVVRNVGIGTIGNLVGAYRNSGRFRTSGIDAQFDWSLDLEEAGLGVPGRFTVNTVFNYLISLKSSSSPSNPLREYAGTMGVGENGLNPGTYRWKLFNTFGYSTDRFRIALQWQHLPSAKSANYASDRNTTNAGAPAYDIFHLNGSFVVTENASVRFGVDNLFDKAPPLILYNNAPDASRGQLRGGTLGASNVAAAGQLYDLIGRRFYIGATFNF